MTKLNLTPDEAKLLARVVTWGIKTEKITEQVDFDPVVGASLLGKVLDLAEGLVVSGNSPKMGGESF